MCHHTPQSAERAKSISPIEILLASAFLIHTMNARTAKKLIEELPLTINDIARITLEITERLGKAAEGLTRVEISPIPHSAAQRFWKDIKV